MNKIYLYFSAIALFMLLNGCGKEDPNQGGVDQADWRLPISLIFDGGPGKDGIPSVDDPKYTKANEVSFLLDSDLVDVFIDGDEMVAYPHDILDWHEIVNDKVGGQAVTVTYCPLTGTGIAWDRVVNGVETTFGVSGLLYNTNLMPYDRSSNSTWSQIRQDCVNGELVDSKAEQLPLLEMKFSDLRQYYPNADVVNEFTGFDRAYGSYPYGDYLTNNDRLIFPVTNQDDRLPKKERVLAIPSDSTAYIVSFDALDSNENVIVTNMADKTVLIFGDKQRNYINAIEISSNDADSFIYSSAGYPNVLLHEDGRTFDIFGRSTDGGEDLTIANNYIGYYFSFPAFFDEVIIVE